MNLPVPPYPELLALPQWRTVDCVADLHLHHAEPATWAAWRRYLQHTQADALLILGDLFEVWVGDDAIDEPGSFEAQCCAALREATARLPVYFMQGNRDFLTGAHLLNASGMQPLLDPTVLVFAGQRYLLSHGDALCLDDVDYQRFRATSRTAAWRSAFLAQPLPERRAAARHIRSQSEARKQSSPSYADVDAAMARRWLQAAQAPLLIHGHTHRPASHTLGPGLARTVLSDWDLTAEPPRAQVLRLSAAGPQRLPCAAAI